MKSKLFFLSAFLIIISGFIYLSRESSVNAPVVWTGPPGDKFIYGAIQSIWSYPNYDSLALNTTHCYVSTVYDSNLHRHVPMGWAGSHDSLNADITAYANDLRFAKSTMFSHNQSTFLYQRPKIEWLAFGQSSTYEAEPVSTGDDLWFYSFNVSDGEPVTDSGKTVLHCGTPSMGPNAGIILQRLKANTEQCKRSQSDGSENHWQCDSESEWLIKPRIRIDSTVAHNSGNTNVCRIIVLNQDRDTIKNALIKAVNFINPVNGHYGGQYLEEFYSLSGTDSLKINGDWGDWWGLSARGSEPTDAGRNGADIQVYWYDNCDMWIDYVKVENDVAHRLLKGNDVQFEDWINDEVDIALENDGIYKFYVEIIEFNNLPCINYLNERLRYYSGNQLDLIVDFDPAWGLLYHVNAADLPTVSSAQWLYDNFIIRGGFSTLLTQCYPMRSRYHDPPDPDPDFTFSRIPPTLPRTSGLNSHILALPSATTGEYDTWLQTNFEDYPFFLENGTLPDGLFDTTHPCGPTAYAKGPQFYGYMRYTMQVSHEISRIGDIPFIFMPQAHQWYYPWEIDREPTNEELEVMANLAISYGARGLMWWWYPTIENISDTACPRITYGMHDPGGSLRDENVYEQTYPKWKVFRDIGNKVKKWEPYLTSFNNTDRRSYVFHNEYSDCFTETYFNDIKTYEPVTPLSITPSSTPDDIEDTYIQASVFKKDSEPKISYFMLTNRRCSPYDASESEDGGRRFVKVKFKNNTSWGTWKISNVADRSDTVSFNRNSSPYVNLGWFMPGEGKLYKMVPVMVMGGTLLTHENISNETFTCEDTVISGGFNITIDSGSTVSFTDSASIIMSGGTFQSGIHGQNQLTTYKGAGSSKWPGMKFSNSTVKIYNSKFQDISSPTVNYAVKMVNCPLGDIRTNQFVLDTDTAGAVQSVYSSAGFFTGLYINYNSVTMNNSRGYGFAVQGFGGLTLPVYVGSNTMTSNGYAMGVFLSTITGGAVKSNSITGFSTGINAISSSIDIFGNTISNTSSVSKGIILSGTGNAGLLPSAGVWLGGFNTITNTSGASRNIEVNGSTYLLEEGYNTFDISSTAGAFHLIGSFPTTYSTKSTGNCFKIAGTEITSPSLPLDSVLDNYTEITFDYISYTCGGSLPEGQTVVDIGGGLYDTIPGSSGEGAGYSSRKVLTLTASQLFDSVRVNIRKQNYATVKTYAEALLEGHASTYEAVSVLQPLYLAVVSTDTSSTGITALKNYYAELILDNGENAQLIKLCHYLSLKCMVLLGQYSSAMTGFQQIITNNPYSYEGLVAKWDYMATSLLAPGGGSVREESEATTPPFGHPSLVRRGVLDPSEYEFEKLYGDDKNPLTKEQKQQIYSSVKNVFETTKNDDDRKIKTLEENSAKGDEGSKHELKQMLMMKEIIKPEKPKSMTEHIAIVSSDAQRVFGNTAPVTETKNTGIPREFSLSQNYPNPFNPVTTIKYSLPNDVKVVIKIYDILGREVRTLVNQFQQTGYYDVKFDGSSYASGVYFYRIEAGNFAVSKKMVLVK